MQRVLVTGALGQLGSELVPHLRERLGAEAVVATDIRENPASPAMHGGPFHLVDVLDAEAVARVVAEHEIDTVFHLAALLSAVAEAKPQAAWKLNMGGLFGMLELARERSLSVFTPSSIGAFGPGTPADPTPQDTLQRPTSMYGVTKVAGELLCDYYAHRYGVDTRGVRFPGLISSVAPPGGGTTDYAVDIYYQALTEGHFRCFLRPDSRLDMMYMPDALQAIVALMQAPAEHLVHRNAFNVTAMSVTPEEIAAAIREHIPSFTIAYDIDPVRQAIADSWPDRLDASAARSEWGFDPQWDLARMTADMLERLERKLGVSRPA